MVLLGAGASAEAGVPTSTEMTVQLVRYLNDEAPLIMPVTKKIINFVAGGLLFRTGDVGNNPLDSGIDIEDMLNALNLLAERRSLEVSPFVNTWNYTLEQLDKIDPPGLDISKIMESLQDLIDANEEGVDSGGRKISPEVRLQISRKLSEALRQQQSIEGNGEHFRRTADIMTMALATFVNVRDTEKVAYLAPLVRAVANRGRLVIATLNYDNLIELAAESVGITCNTGIEGWSESGEFNFGSSGLHLIKLHGSIDWRRAEVYRAKDQKMPHLRILKHGPPSLFRAGLRGTTELPAILFGQRNKLTAEGPFLGLLRAFQSELDASNSLTVIGYSFRDLHINIFISNWLNRSSENRLTVVDKYIEESKVQYVGPLKEFSQAHPEQVRLMPVLASEGIAELYPNAATVDF